MIVGDSRYRDGILSDENLLCDWEADIFARAFLMPSNRVRKFVEKNGIDVFQIASYFKVPVGIASERLKELGLL